LQIARASLGFSSKNCESDEFTLVCTRPSTPGLPSFVFVCPSNCGFWSLTETTAASPSRTSSPSRLSSFFSSLRSCAFAFRVRVRALRKPDRCEPPSTVLMLLAKVKDRLLVRGSTASRPRRALLGLALEVDDVRWIESFASLMYETKSRMPPS
jgi:hypothetical protein